MFWKYPVFQCIILDYVLVIVYKWTMQWIILIFEVSYISLQFSRKCFSNCVLKRPICFGIWSFTWTLRDVGWNGMCVCVYVLNSGIWVWAICFNVAWYVTFLFISNYRSYRNHNSAFQVPPGLFWDSCVHSAKSLNSSYCMKYLKVKHLDS